MKVLRCPCGEQITAATEEEIIARAKDHLERAHPDLADEYGPEHILFMTQDFPDP